MFCPNARPRRTSWPLVLLAIAALGLTACSDSPTDPGGDGSGPDNFVDVPPIPEPATPGGDVPSRSEERSRVEALDGNFRAVVADAFGDWTGERRCGTSTTQLEPQTDWASAVPTGSPFDILARTVEGRTFDLIDAAGGELAVEISRTQLSSCSGVPFTPYGQQVTLFQSRVFAADVHIRRDRHWELKPLEGNAGDYLLVYPNTQGQISTSYQSGSERTRTEEFGRSVTAEAGLSFGPLSASVSATLSETFSSSVTVSESTTETFTKTVTGKEGAIVQFMVWELVENYSFVDADGMPLTDENFQLNLATLQRRGSAIALQSTEFPLEP